jgi:hypothetical protein
LETLVHVSVRLLLKYAARIGETEDIEAVIHGLLERTLLPTKDVVTVMSIAGAGQSVS